MPLFVLLMRYSSFSSKSAGSPPRQIRKVFSLTTFSSVLVDDDPKGRALKGLIGFQVHVGDPMKVEFKNIWLKLY